MNLPKGWKVMLMKHNILLLIFNGVVKKAYNTKDQTNKELADDINSIIKKQ